ncbi:histidine phosphatase family protein [Sedimentibacter sp.]|uniref:histidine phosphatase family protein n=1 Tax=Sedimentibacter sp. TaxID=1960295 RepID=UPI0028AE296A|nr:histidine phosphatase family protein [Sedimentibacter sp.]
MIYLVRHGESEANIQNRFSGITDVELSAKGRKQAAIAGNNVKPYKIDYAYSSPLKRANDTAKIICDVNNIDVNEIIIENSLIEVNFGLFENMTWDEIRENHREESENWISYKHRYKFPEGESYDDIVNRISSFVDKVPDSSLIVTHFGVIQSILLYLDIADDNNLWDYMIKNCDIIVLDKNNGKIEKIIKNMSSERREESHQ